MTYHATQRSSGAPRGAPQTRATQAAQQLAQLQRTLQERTPERKAHTAGWWAVASICLRQVQGLLESAL